MSIQHDELQKQLRGLFPRLRRLASRLTSSQDDGEDIVQQSLEIVMSDPVARWPGASLDRFLFKSMNNIWNAEADKRRERQLGNERECSFGRQSSIMQAKVRAFFARLPVEQRKAITLVVVDGQSYREAASELQIPIGTLMSQLSRGRESIRMMMEDRGRPK